MKFLTCAWSVLSITALTAAASAQCINIDVGCNPLTIPPATYGASSGQWGSWNPVPFNPAALPLTDISGFATTATVTAVSTPFVLCKSTPFFPVATGPGGMLNDYSEVPAAPPGESTTWTINGLTPFGIYNVYIYAWSSTAPLTDFTSVTKPSGGLPVACGGWAGAGVAPQGGAYIADMGVNVGAGGSLSFTIAPFGASVRGCLNGIQIVDTAGACPGFDSYCVAGFNSLACAAHLTAEGTPSATALDGFVITANEVVAQKAGLFFYGINGALAMPFSCGTLCVKPPLRRTGVQNSGGAAGTCGGSMSFDWNTYISTAVGELGEVWSTGDEVWVQAWFRDPAGCGTFTAVTDALHFALAP